MVYNGSYWLYTKACIKYSSSWSAYNQQNIPGGPQVQALRGAPRLAIGVHEQVRAHLDDSYETW